MRAILTRPTTGDDGVVAGALVDMFAEGDRPEQTFWIAEDEAETLIRALAKNFGLDVAAMG